MRPTTRRRSILTAMATATALLVPMAALAYDPTGSTVYQLPSEQPCLKGRGNCAIYPKSAQLPSGRLVMAFEKSTVVAASGGAAGQTLPVYTSDDDGATWQQRSEVAAPAALSDDPAVARYTSNWTNPYLYVLPEDVGDLAAGTLLLASAVSGEDAYYAERKTDDPSWVPSNDGDRSDLAIALFASTDEGESWDFLNIVATGGWQGGAAGATGQNVAAANAYRQVDPVWEPHLLVHDGELIAYYSDENDHRPFDPTTGAAVIAPDNATAADSHGQVLVHRTWNGTGAAWSEPVVDVPGLTETRNGAQQIGGGRPGMTNVVPTTDGKWVLTFEYFGGGANTRFKIADDPTEFFADGDPDGTGVDALPVDTGSRKLAQGGSPVIIALPDGRLVYNASGSGSVWVNESGRSDGTWTEFQTPIGAGYSRTLQHVQDTGRVVIFQSVWGGATAGASIRRAEVDLGRSAGPYVQITNKATGQVIGTGGSTNDANLGNADVPDVVTEDAAAAPDDTQLWHLASKNDGNLSLLNRSGGRAASVWTGNAVAGQRIGQWVDDQAVGSWRLVDSQDGYQRIQSVRNPALYLTAPLGGGQLTLQPATADGTQEWLLAEPVAVPAAWDAAATYTDGGTVSYGGSTWTATWWTRGQIPGDPYGPWQEVRTAADGTAVWTASRIFVAGETVRHGGLTYQAQWWTRNQAPGDPNGPWKVTTS